jgi:glycosyltransferase involved in cell wall biosynthesis
MAQKKILVLGKLPPPYMGPSVAFEIIINSGLKKIYDLHYLDVKANESLLTLGKWNLKKVFINLRIYKKLFSMLNEVKPDLVLIPISQATLGFIKDSVFILLCRITGTKVMIQLRGSEIRKWISRSSWLTKLYVKFILSLPSGVIVLGENLRYLFADYFSPERIFVVPNGSDYNITEKVYSDQPPVKIIYLANLQPTKGIEDLIDAINILKQDNAGSFQLDVVGLWRKKETEEYCKKITNENNLPVIFHGPGGGISKFKYLLDADIFVFAPRAPEGHPWVIIEAMAAGLPIISTDQGAIVESVKDQVNGFIVKSQSPPDIADKLRILIKNPELRKSMGKRSREIYLENFTETIMVNNFRKAFDAVINMG